MRKGGLGNSLITNQQDDRFGGIIGIIGIIGNLRLIKVQVL